MSDLKGKRVLAIREGDRSNEAIWTAGDGS
jgi:hypothetical protein